MRILDRERYWAFLKAYIICFVALVGLYVVIHAFTNLDEFTERSDGIVQLFQVMGQFYMIRLSLFYDQLCGIISMMAAIFTVTWMQKNNELIAMLAAGISTYRVIRPVYISAVLVCGLAVANQELILPGVAEELQKGPDDDGRRKVPVYSNYDSNGILISGKSADRASRTVLNFNATLPVQILGVIRELQAKQARYIGPENPRAPLKGGWLLRGARISLKDPGSGEPLKTDLLIRLDDLKGFPPPVGTPGDMEGEAYFLRSDLTFQAVSRSRQWYQFASTKDLLHSLSDPANSSERMEIAVFLHGRILRSLLSLNLMFLSLPIVLGGVGGNMFINLALSLGLSGVFYGVAFTSQYLGTNDILSPELAAWVPLIGFGTLAVFRWDSIKT
jgi:lipopolysaccharide export system permease protein